MSTEHTCEHALGENNHANALETDKGTLAECSTTFEGRQESHLSSVPRNWHLVAVQRWRGLPLNSNCFRVAWPSKLLKFSGFPSRSGLVAGPCCLLCPLRPWPPPAWRCAMQGCARALLGRSGSGVRDRFTKTPTLQSASNGACGTAKPL